MVTVDRYWNTWNPDSCSSMEHIVTGMRIVPGAYSEAFSSYGQFPYNKNMKLYEHTKNGNYCRLTAVHENAEFEIEYLKPEPWTVLMRMTNIKEPLEWGIRYHMLVSVGFPDGNGTMLSDFANLLKGESDNYKIAVSYYGEEPYDIVPAQTSCYVGESMAKGGFKSTVESDGEKPCWATLRYVLEQSPQLCLSISIAHDDETAKKNADAALHFFDIWDEKKAELLKEFPSSEDESHGGMIEAVSDVMTWNAMYSPELKRTYTSIAKTWNKNFGGWYSFFSDSCYQIMLTAFAGDVEMASENLFYSLSAVTPDGNFAGMLSPYERWVDRTQPPVLAFNLWMYYLLSGDIASLEQAYPILRRAQKWFLEKRTKEGSVLVRLGTSKTGDGSYRGTKLAAKNEAAMDNSPMYDEIVFNKEEGMLEAYDVGLSSLLLLDIECTEYIARELGQTKDAEKLGLLAEEMKKEISKELWDSSNQIYSNRLFDGNYGVTSPTSFYPLAAGVPDEKRAEELIKHIFDEEEFFTECPLIAINAKSPSAKDNKYWRGRTWAPQSFWTYIGLRRYGKVKEANRLADKAVKYFEKHWNETRRSYENYNPYTGEAEDSVDVQPFYSWTALLPLIWSFESWGVNPWDGYYFGLSDGGKFKQNNRKYRGNFYDAFSDGEVTVLLKNGKEIFRSDVKGRFTQFIYGEHYCKTVVDAPEEGYVEFLEIQPEYIYVNGMQLSESAKIPVNKGRSCVEIYC